MTLKYQLMTRTLILSIGIVKQNNIRVGQTD